MVQSYSEFWRADYEKSYFKIFVSYMRVATEIVKSLVEVLYSFIEQARNSGRHDGGLASLQRKKLFSIGWENSMKFWRAVFEKSALTIFVLLWPLAIHFSTKLLLPLQVSISSNKTKSGRHDGGLMPFHTQFNLLLWCKGILNSDEPIMKNLTSKYSCHIFGLQQKLWSLLLKYYIHSLRNNVVQGGTMAD